MELKIVGARKKRYDGLAHVSGETKFVDDVVVPGTLSVKAFRSPVSKGKIRNIDLSAAQGLPGVVAIITAADVPQNAFGMMPDQPVLAGEDIRYKGEPIAAVAAMDRRTAQAAVDLIKADIEEHQPVFDPIEAMKEGAPKVRPEGNVFEYGPNPFHRVNLGDVDKGFEAADRIIESSFFHSDMEHTALETQCSLVVPDAKGKITIYSNSQCLSLHAGMIAGVLSVPDDAVRAECVAGWSEKTKSSWSTKGSLNNVHMIGGTVGGGFGGKNDIHADHVTALLALKTGRPCKWRWTREEEILYSTHRGAWYMEVTDGVMNDGRIVARKVKGIRDAGAYASFNVLAAVKFSYFCSGPYAIPNIQNDGYCVFTNKPPSSSMRGFAVTPSTYAIEMQMNRIAAEIGIDPWEIRMKNALRNSDTLAVQQVINDAAYIETLQALAAKAGVSLPAHLMEMSSTERGGN